jgi:hypothetical protein
MNANHAPTRLHRTTVRLGAGCCAALILTLGPAAADPGSDAERPVAEVEPVGERASASLARRAAKAQYPRLKPTVEEGLSARVRSRLSSALRFASQQVVKVDSCAALFSDLGADGREQLARAVYYLPSVDQKERLCIQGGGAAFALVGGYRIGICTKQFVNLTQWEAAMTLIHEALHHAGMPERPAVPNALSSREINKLVRVSCNL